MKSKNIKNVLSNWRKLSPLKKRKYAGFTIGGIIIICLLIFISFPDPLINSLFKDKITNTIKAAFPKYSIQISDLHYNIWKNRLKIDSIILNTRDSTILGSVKDFSLGGINWMKILRAKVLDPNTLKDLVMDAQKIELIFNKSQGELSIGNIHISVPDSEMVADSLKYYSLIDDEQFFAKSRFRQTRFYINLPKIEIIGLDYLPLLEGKTYKAASINIRDIFVDIMVNLDKAYDINSPNPKMPNEFFSSLTEIIRIDSVKITNGLLKYAERTAVGTQPGVITINKINVLVNGIANHTEQPVTTIINGEGLLMNSDTLKLLMAIPLTSKDFTLQYSGSIGKMDVNLINRFIEPVEHKRIKSGILHSATFNINVKSGHAGGTVAIVYDNLSIVAINPNTGSENGVFNRIASIFGKLFVIRSSNMPDEKSLIKMGEIKFVRKPVNPFFQFVWYALRSGVADIVGFPPE
jgi:hypothetical protein